MDDQDRWLRIAAEILDAPDPAVAHELLAKSLTRQTHADVVMRIALRVEEPDDVEITVDAREAPPRELWPDAELMHAHPLSRYYAGTGDRSPVRLTDLLVAGWQFDEQGRALAEALGFTEHQMTLPCRPGGGFDGWAAVSDDGFTEDDLARLTALQPLLVGLDRHVALLTEMTARPTGPAPDAVPLTPRELLVLRLMATGVTAEAIALRLAVSPRTVHKHQEHLYRKLRASDRLSAVLAAQRLGLVPAPGAGA
ncbi:LuxR C-terminal-related transcriptional regulator [Terrabacter sp. NPDC080008]|uniref:helix-turn-helix transcriptional regulator n=1 Tax=Terrabacter sp. NPDC080008 TaxID=3155176 RepID=UPI00344D91EF